TDPRANGRLGVRRDFRSDDKEMNKENNRFWSLYEEPTWDNVNEIHAAILISSGQYRGPMYISDFERLKSVVMCVDRPEDSRHLQNLEQAAEICLRHLEILHECYQKWIKVYESENEDEEWDSAHYLHMIREITSLTEKIDTFSTNLSMCADYFHESSLRVPLPNDNLSDSLGSLATTYQAAYQSMSSFWRWVKKLFQQGERDMEVQFLQTLSQTEGCTDSIRIRAVELVHNKINDEYFGSSSLFGSGSRLKNILGLLAQKRVEVEMGEENELFSFIDKHHLELPPELSAYCETVNRDETMVP
ncbi:hypothetical protein Ldro_0794, partial [Legionella drozanskii LLAP-1]